MFTFLEVMTKIQSAAFILFFFPHKFCVFVFILKNLVVTSLNLEDEDMFSTKIWERTAHCRSDITQ